jgi:D-sedoheptulose 7-phosphate isomerase
MQELAESVRNYMLDSAKLKQSLAETHAEAIAALAVTVARAFFKGNKVLLCGNGGSASDAQHIAAEFVGRFRRERIALPSVALTANGPTMTAIGNDYGYEYVFERQVRALAKSGDVFIGITTSGRSPNVVAAAKVAKSLGLSTVSLTGGHPSPLSEICDVHLSVPSNVTARVQEAHILMCHTNCCFLKTSRRALSGACRCRSSRRSRICWQCGIGGGDSGSKWFGPTAALTCCMSGMYGICRQRRRWETS